MPLFEDLQQPVSWDSDNFLGAVSEEIASLQNIDRDHPKTDDDFSEDSFAVENAQLYRSLRQLLDQIIGSWQNPDPGLIQAAETNDSGIDSGDIADLEAKTLNQEESSFRFLIIKPLRRKNHGKKKSVNRLKHKKKHINFCIVNKIQ